MDLSILRGWCIRQSGFACWAARLSYFSLARYSRTIIRISPLTDVPFFCAICRNFSIISGEKKTFVLSLLAFGLGDNIHTPLWYDNITI